MAINQAQQDTNSQTSRPARPNSYGNLRVPNPPASLSPEQMSHLLEIEAQITAQLANIAGILGEIGGKYGY